MECEVKLFCVLLVEEGKRRRGGATFRKPKIRRVDCGNFGYEIISVRAKRNRLNFDKTCAAIRGRPTVKQVDINITDNSLIPLFDATRYKQHIEIKTILAILTKAAEYKRLISIAFVDLDCRFCGCLEPLMNISSEVYIITNEITQYNEYANEYFSLFGVAPIVTNGTDIQSKCNVIFSPDGKGVLPLDKVVFAPRNECYHIDGDCLSMINGCPEKINKIEFAGALFELCNIERFGNIKGDYMKRNGVKEDIKSIVERICLDIS